MAGGTWRIIVEEGSQKSPTQSSISGGGKPATTQKIFDRGKANEKSSGFKRATGTVLGAGLGLSLYGIGEYYSITGQEAMKNKLSVAVTYGGAGIAFTQALATGNLVKAGVVAVGTGALYARQRTNFAKDVMEQNALAERLRQQSNISVSHNRGDMYALKF